MPLTEKGNKILSHLEKEYGEKKGKSVLYAGENKGTFTGIHDARPRRRRKSKDAWLNIEQNAPTPEEYRVYLNAKDARSRLHHALDRVMGHDCGMNMDCDCAARDKSEAPPFSQTIREMLKPQKGKDRQRLHKALDHMLDMKKPGRDHLVGGKDRRAHDDAGAQILGILNTLGETFLDLTGLDPH